MNCDEAFDAITNLDQAHASALKWHLEFCPRCREMQQVLAPALALFSGEEEPADRSAEAEAEADFPLHRLAPLAEDSPASPTPFLTPEAVHLAEQTARRLQSSSPAKRGKFWQRWFAVSAVCVLMLMGAYQWLQPAAQVSPGQHAEPLMLADQCLWTERDAETSPPATAQQNSRWVVLSCVSCHLEQSIE